MSLRGSVEFASLVSARRTFRDNFEVFLATPKCFGDDLLRYNDCVAIHLRSLENAGHIIIGPFRTSKWLIAKSTQRGLALAYSAAWVRPMAEMVTPSESTEVLPAAEIACETS